MHGDHLDAVLPAALEHRVEQLLVVEAKHAHLAVDDVDGIELQADDAPLLDLPVEIVERLPALQRADAAIEEDALRVPALQLEADRHRRQVVEEAPGRHRVIDREIDVALEEQQRFQHVGADRLEIAQRLDPIGLGHHRPLEAEIGRAARRARTG